MPRKVVVVTIDAPGRDAGKTFQITELSAVRAEKWAARALLALARSGVEVPEDIAASGLAGVATLGLRAFGGMQFADAEPLLAEMMDCVKIITDPSRPQVSRGLIEAQDDIEEVATLLRLREEVISLHLGFSISAFRSRLTAAAPTPEPSSNTATSAAP